MSKRKLNILRLTQDLINDLQRIERRKKRVKRRHVKYQEAPPVYTLADLIELGNSSRMYRNFNMEMLWKIVPYLQRLNAMIGMRKLKETVFDQVIYYLQGLHLRNSDEYLHTLILGIPGSGKTTVGEILGNIFKEMGILKKDGPFHKAKSADLVAEYVGQTAPRTLKFLKKCLGGVCLFDEFYTLGNPKEKLTSFSRKAINVLNQFLSEHKNDFMFIGVGYENKIKDYIFSVNEGLERRFQWIHRIEEYKSIDLADITLKMVSDIYWEICVSREKIAELIEQNKELFKDAGGSVEKFISVCKICHSRRVFILGPEHKYILTLKDLEMAIEMMKKNLMNEGEDDKPPWGMYC